MSRADEDLWPWLLAGSVFAGIGAVIVLAGTRTPIQTSKAPLRPQPRQPPETPSIPARLPQRLETYTEDDVEAAARMLASENPRGSEQLHIEQIWTQLRSRRHGQSLYQRITAGSGYGQQGDRKAPGGKRPVATVEPATNRFRLLAESVLRGERSSTLLGARKYFEPEQQDRAFAKAEAARKILAAGGVLTKAQQRLIGYKMDDDTRI